MIMAVSRGNMDIYKKDNIRIEVKKLENRGGVIDTDFIIYFTNQEKKTNKLKITGFNNFKLLQQLLDDIDRDFLAKAVKQLTGKDV